MSGPAFELLEAKRKKIAMELAQLEKQIYEEETHYFINDHSSFGNVLKGFEGFLTSKNAQAKNKNRVFNLPDRGFSLSSYTSPATRELQDEQQQRYLEATRAHQIRGAMPYAVRTMEGVPPAKQGRY